MYSTHSVRCAYMHCTYLQARYSLVSLSVLTLRTTAHIVDGARARTLLLLYAFFFHVFSRSFFLNPFSSISSFPLNRSIHYKQTMCFFIIMLVKLKAKSKMCVRVRICFQILQIFVSSIKRAQAWRLPYYEKVFHRTLFW